REPHPLATFSVSVVITFLSYMIYKMLNDPFYLFHMALSGCAKNNFTILHILKFIGLPLDDEDPFKRVGTIDGYYFPLLKSAAQNNNDALFKFLIDNGIKPSPMMLYYACKDNNTE